MDYSSKRRMISFVCILGGVLLLGVIGFSVYMAVQKPTQSEEPKQEQEHEVVEEVEPTKPQNPGTTKSTQGLYPVNAAQSVLGTRLCERYENNFYVGVCIASSTIDDEAYVKMILEQYNSITCENEMKPEKLLLQKVCQRTGKVNVSIPTSMKKICDWAMENGMKMRGHTLVWYSQTPDWFFRENFDSKGAYVTREVMLERMESYIKQVVEYCDTNYPGLFYAWDVANEVFTDDGDDYRSCPWYNIIGEDYVTYAFQYARKYCSPDTKLFLNDFNTYMSAKTLRMKMVAAKLKEQGLIDGIGMQCHLDVNFPKASAVVATAKTFSDLGLEVQITELDVTTEANEGGWKKQAEYVDAIFSGLSEADTNGITNLTSVTVWGIKDDLSWRSAQDPLFFDDNLEPKESYNALLQE